MTFSEHHYWSIFHDANVARISVPNERGGEFFVIVKTDGKGYRARRQAAVELCLEAIEAGCDPGEVRLA